MPPQYRTIGPGEPGFDFLKRAGIDDVVVFVGEEFRDFRLQLLNALFGGRITREGVANLGMQWHFGHDWHGLGDARSNVGLFAVQFF